uniref:Uncharacterized protein n=1 Tax=Arundo donax TaxID=35708 RepID=A0A0A8ZQ48_ARUDO
MLLTIAGYCEQFTRVNCRYAVSVIRML